MKHMFYVTALASIKMSRDNDSTCISNQSEKLQHSVGHATENTGTRSRNIFVPGALNIFTC